ncbi:hypothetical protein [Rhodoligotrophos defluvii]|uniref:hypothetical protein n=1 Tax=Rhodoligotrophos defluvii TaxID=2561934 RepID=UPI0010C958B3|nr:hypothetical protein [Rhodoligotrophos defluvii]
MTGRFIMAMLVAAGLVSGLATAVTPSAVESAQPKIAASPVASAHSGRNVTAIKNQAWPPAAMITVEPCAIAECRDA